jgi:hypothetical protein
MLLLPRVPGCGDADRLRMAAQGRRPGVGDRGGVPAAVAEGDRDLLRVGPQREPVAQDARVGDEDVEPAEGRQRRRDQPVGGLGRPDRSGVRDGSAARPRPVALIGPDPELAAMLDRYPIRYRVMSARQGWDEDSGRGDATIRSA